LARGILADAVVEHAGSAAGRASNSAVFYGQQSQWTWLKNSPRRVLWRSAAGHVLCDIAGCAAYAQRGSSVPVCTANWAALMGSPDADQRRAVSNRGRRRGVWGLMDADWLDVKRREKRFDFSGARSAEAGHCSGVAFSPTRSRSSRTAPELASGRCQWAIGAVGNAVTARDRDRQTHTPWTDAISAYTQRRPDAVSRRQ
jgi:hypothetical protein